MKNLILEIAALFLTAISAHADCTVKVNGSDRHSDFLNELVRSIPGIQITKSNAYDVQVSYSKGKRRFQNPKGGIPKVKKYIRITLESPENTLIEKKTETAGTIETPSFHAWWEKPTAGDSVGANDGGLSLTRTNRMIKKALSRVGYFKTCTEVKSE